MCLYVYVYIYVYIYIYTMFDNKPLGVHACTCWVVVHAKICTSVCNHIYTDTDPEFGARADALQTDPVRV